MDDRELDTVNIREFVARYRLGDNQAIDELIVRSKGRLEKIARKMIKTFPVVNSRVQTDDVLQQALMNLVGSLKQVTPKSVRHFYRLASTHVRRELLDLARKYRRRLANREFIGLQHNDESWVENQRNPTDGSHELQEELDRLEEFHSAVEQLEPLLREVFSLTYYHGWPQLEIAELLEISDRQVRRLLRAACVEIQNSVGEQKIPPP